MPAAAATSPRFSTSCGFNRRVTASYAAIPADTAICHYRDPRDVLRSSVTVRVSSIWSALSESEREPQRQRGQCVAEVVDGVVQQRNRARNGHNCQLQHCRGDETDEGDLDRSYAPLTRLERPVYALVRIVMVGPHQVCYPPTDTGGSVSVMRLVTGVSHRRDIPMR